MANKADHIQRVIQPGDPLEHMASSVFAGLEDIEPHTVSMSPRPLQMLALAGTESGCGTLHGDGYTAKHKPRTIMVMVPQNQFRDVAGERMWRTHWLIIGGPLAEAWARDVAPRPPSVAVHRTPPAIASALKEACVACIEGKANWQWKWLADVTRVLEFCRQSIADRADTHVSLAHRARQLMRAHAEAPLSLEQLAEKLDISPSTLSHGFKDETGLSPQRAYREVRIARSQQLLASGATVTDVSDAMGFANPYHFSRTFSRVVGIPPSRFRAEKVSPPLRRGE